MTDQQPQPRPHFWLRAGFWRGLMRLLVAVVLLALTAAVWVLVHPPSLEPVREELQEWLGKRLDRRVAFRNLTWTWADGLQVRAQQVQVGGRGLSAEEVRLAVASVPLLWGEVRLHGLKLVGLDLALERDAAGRIHAGGFRVNPERNVVFPLLARFERLTIREGTLRWTDRLPGDPASVTLHHWNLTIDSRNGGARVDVSAGIDKGQVRAAGTLKGLAGGPGAWRMAVTVTGKDLPVGQLRPYLGPAGVKGLEGTLDLQGHVEGELGGTVTAEGQAALRHLGLRWPARLRHPLTDLRLAGRFRVEWGEGRRRLALSGLEAKAYGVRAQAAGGLQWGPAVGPARIDAQGRLGPVALPKLHPFFQVQALPRPVLDWLERSLVAGRVEAARFTVRGPLRRFPFPDRKGTFRVEADLAEVRLAYWPGWPAAESLSGTLVFDRERLAFRGKGGRILRGQIQGLEASIHDLAGSPPQLRLRGDVDLPLADGVRFLERSPLMESGFLGQATLVGPANLRLRLVLPLGKAGSPSVFGTLGLDRAALRPAPGLPALVRIKGAVSFQGANLRGKGLRARLLGEPVALTLHRGEADGLRLRIKGSFPANALRQALHRQGIRPDLTRRLTGELEAAIEVAQGSRGLRWRMDADLAQAGLILPEPAFNAIGEAGALEVWGETGETGLVQALLSDSGNRWRLALRPQGEDRGWGLAAGFGRESPAPETGSVRVVGSLGAVPLGEWLALVRRVSGKGADELGGLPSRLSADIEVGALDIAGQDLGGGRIVLEGRGKAEDYLVIADLAGERAAGRVAWTRRSPGRDRLEVRLSRLRLPAPGKWGEGSAPAKVVWETAPLDLTVKVDRVALGKQVMKGLRLQAQLFRDRWLLHGLQAGLGGSDLRLQGEWRAGPDRTEVRVDLDTQDFGGWLRDLGLYPSMKGGRGTFGGTLAWSGRPSEFDPNGLDGDLRLRMVEGEIEELYFLSKALATLNVLDWPQQLVRGLKDVGRSGLVYRELAGEVQISEGVASTDGWVLESAPLRMTVAGSLDLGARTYDLHIQLQPLQTVDRIVAAVPLLGYLLTGEEKTFLSLEYFVVGPWADPRIRGLSTEEEETDFMDTLIRRIREMEWEDLLPWR